MSAMPAALAERARAVARALQGGGHRAWLVGGCVRDLALAVEPKDCDMASAATPEEVEQLFPRTYAVGRAFGTIVVHFESGDVQVTTFRSERGYRDARRPDQVAWGSSPEEDSRRRDFTCNALYLDPLSDEVLDPQGGLADLERARLRCVGEAAQRFGEDGLRIVRMARFAAAYDLAVEPATLAAARASLDALAGVSPERVQAEFALIFARPRPWIALRLLDSVGALERLIPELAALHGASTDRSASLERRWRAFEAFGDAPGPESGWCLLLDPSFGRHGVDASDPAPALAALERVRPSNALRTAVKRLLERVAAIAAIAEGAHDAIPRWKQVETVAAPDFALALRIGRAWRAAEGAGADDLDRLEAFARSIPPEDRAPIPLLAPEDLARAGVPRGPRWGTLLAEARRAQVELGWRTRAEALAWLELRARENFT
jgi:poly(A) polymerase